MVPKETDNVDDIMAHFSGREEELIKTLRSMQKSRSRRARAAVERSSKVEAGKKRESPLFHGMDESSEGDIRDMGVTTAETTEGKGVTRHATVSQQHARPRSYVRDAQDMRPYVSDA